MQHPAVEFQVYPAGQQPFLGSHVIPAQFESLLQYNCPVPPQVPSLHLLQSVFVQSNSSPHCPFEHIIPEQFASEVHFFGPIPPHRLFVQVLHWASSEHGGLMQIPDESRQQLFVALLGSVPHLMAPAGQHLSASHAPTPGDGHGARVGSLAQVAVATHLPPQHVNWPPPVLHSQPVPPLSEPVNMLLSQSLQPALQVSVPLDAHLPMKQIFVMFKVLQSIVPSLLQSELPDTQAVQVKLQSDPVHCGGISHWHWFVQHLEVHPICQSGHPSCSHGFAPSGQHVPLSSVQHNFVCSSYCIPCPHLSQEHNAQNFDPVRISMNIGAKT